MNKTSRILILACSLFITATVSQAQETKKKESRLVEIERVNTTNPEVAKLKEGVNDKQELKKPPVPKESGLVYGDNMCDVIVDNYTNLYIKVWVDNNYKGVLAPYGKITVAAVPGKTVLYARADYTDGSYSYWNPSAFDCQWEYTWRLK